MEDLSRKLEGVFRRLRGEGRLSEANIAESLREVRRVSVAGPVRVSLLAVAALVLAWALAHLFSRRLTIPMQRLSSVVSRIRRGELGARTESGLNRCQEALMRELASVGERLTRNASELSSTVTSFPFIFTLAI